VAALVLLSVAQAWAQQSPPASLAACRAQIDDNPRAARACYCVYRYVLAHGHQGEAAAMLRKYFRKYPGIYRMQMDIALIDRTRGKGSWLQTLRRAVDEEQPERSAIVLSPGGEHEDGLLQAREITDLRLDGQLVILSSCSTATGRILGGEGAQSLAHAFLEAGAGAVLAGLWPIEDTDAADLFGELSRQLGRRRNVAGALRLAQRHALGRGRPPAAWAGITVLGNGDLRPLPGRRPRLPWTPTVIFLLAAALALLLIRRAR